jgi:Kef-type K+ transport system membrane component KefB
MHGFIQDIGLAFLVATFLGLITQKMRQPIILGYFIAGIIIGPEIGPALVTDPANIDTITEIGLILLLFVIGLEMDVPKIVKAGKKMLVAGIGQFILCVAYGLLLFGLLGYGISGGNLTGLYFALLCAMSSTAIVVKLLYDKFELDTLHGRITVGVLVMQDIWAVMILAFQPNLNNPELQLFAMALLKCIALVGTAYLLSKYVMSRIFRGIAKVPEMVIVTSLGWCTLGAGLAGYLGLSMEMGALVAGVTISMFQYKTFVTGRVLPLRDFFLTLFFVSLGMKIPYPSKTMLLLALGLGGFIVATRFLSVYPLLAFTGSGRRTAFIASMNLSQLSELSRRSGYRTGTSSLPRSARSYTRWRSRR